MNPQKSTAIEQRSKSASNASGSEETASRLHRDAALWAFASRGDVSRCAIALLCSRLRSNQGALCWALDAHLTHICSPRTACLTCFQDAWTSPPHSLIITRKHAALLANRTCLAPLLSGTTATTAVKTEVPLRFPFERNPGRHTLGHDALLQGTRNTTTKRWRSWS